MAKCGRILMLSRWSSCSANRGLCPRRDRPLRRDSVTTPPTDCGFFASLRCGLGAVVAVTSGAVAAIERVLNASRSNKRRYFLPRMMTGFGKPSDELRSSSATRRQAPPARSRPAQALARSDRGRIALTPGRVEMLAGDGRSGGGLVALDGRISGMSCGPLAIERSRSALTDAKMIIRLSPSKQDS